MAEAAVRFVVQKFGELLAQEAINLYGARGEMEWLQRELRQMQCFLKDAEAKKNNGGIVGENVKNWLTDMRDVAFEAEDIIDTFMYYKLLRQQNPGFIKRFVFMFDELVSRHKLHVNVEGIKTKLQELSQSRSLYGIANIGETIGTTSQSRSPGRIPILPQLLDDIDMVGFDDEKKKIVQELLDRNNANRSVITIVGMGGLGKTTLAKSVYNDLEVNRSFNIFAWVIISQQYTILEILKRISSEVSATPSLDTIEGLSGAISEKLQKGKYLIVLDDVWKADVWNELLKVFPNVNNGSRVIITTRLLNVAEVADRTIKPHELRFLNEKESKELFLRKVFPRQDIETCCPTGLMRYARQLVQRCGGLPLALVVLGGLISTKPQTQDAWHKIVDSTKGQFVEGDERCLEILALSYNDLPYYLKSCFLHFACFNEDRGIPTKTMINLWSAEGFLPTNNDKTIEDIGFDCLMELAQRCLIQVTENGYDDSEKLCRIHDLLFDLCISEAKKNNFFEIYQNDTVDCATISNVARRLRLTTFNMTVISNYSNSNLRFLCCNYNDYLTQIGWLGKFKLLRVLYLVGNWTKKIPCEIKSLIHLRYLDLDFGHLREVPSWIGHLRNLQTFILTSTWLEKVSDSLWTIGNLRHVDLPMSNGKFIGKLRHAPNMGNNVLTAQYLFSRANPPNMGNNVPKNLQSLRWVRAGSWIGNTLPKLTNLCELSIYDVSYCHADALSSSLKKLCRLTSLSIVRFRFPFDNIITAFPNEHCLKKLAVIGNLKCKVLPHNAVFPQKLVELHLQRFGLVQDPMATLEKLPCLKYLKLWEAYRGKQMICSATGFPQLLSLSIGDLKKLEEWTIEENAMPCLKYLLINKCQRLKMIPEGLKNVPLDQLKLTTMPNEFVTKIKENTGEDWYKIQKVPNISIIN